MSDQKDELLPKPCPFCGQEPERADGEYRCKNHGGWGRFHLSQEEWNRRTPPPTDVKEPGSEEKAEELFPKERYYGSLWEDARVKINNALSEAYQRGKEEKDTPPTCECNGQPEHAWSQYTCCTATTGQLDYARRKEVSFLEDQVARFKKTADELAAQLKQAEEELFTLREQAKQDWNGSIIQRLNLEMDAYREVAIREKTRDLVFIHGLEHREARTKAEPEIDEEALRLLEQKREGGKTE